MKPLNPENELFSDIILELYKNPLNFGRMKNASLEAEGGNPVCGDKAHIFLRVENGKIVDASFVGSGCAISTAAASLLTEMVKGRTVAEASKLAPEALFEQLGGVIQTRIKCATLALSVLKQALRSENR